MIAIGCDHGGYDLKNILIEHLQQKGLEFHDYGCYSKESVDYPDYAKVVCEAIINGECDKGVLICSTGIGISISANKVNGIRCALVHDLLSAKLTRAHNDSNVLAMGAFIVAPEMAKNILDTWLSTEFEGGRHQRRVDKISALETNE